MTEPQGLRRASASDGDLGEGRSPGATGPARRGTLGRWDSARNAGLVDCDGPPDGSADAPLLILTDSDYEAVRFVLEIVDQLGAAYGFSPGELISPRTNGPFAPFIERLRRGMQLFEAMPPDASGDGDGSNGRGRGVADIGTESAPDVDEATSPDFLAPACPGPSLAALLRRRFGRSPP